MELNYITPRASLPAITNDLFIEILSRLPEKSIARFRCMSKDFASLLHHPYFIERFLANSSDRLRLLFTFHMDGKWHFFSTPQPLNPEPNSSSPLVVDRRHMCIPIDCSRIDRSFGICPPVSGFLCSKDRNTIICNPTTGQYITLPNPKTESTETKTYFGYDPMEQQFKVLCVSSMDTKHHVLTLEKGMSSSWRIVECSVPHVPTERRPGICINGALYYQAKGTRSTIVCFDVRSEKFKFILNHQVKEQGTWISTLINYKGKLGALDTDTSGVFYSRRTKRIGMWVLDDADEHKWSRYIYILPPCWKNVVGNDLLCVVGMTPNGEIVFTSLRWHETDFYIFYYNMERNTIRRIEIKGIEAFKGQKIYTFINHLENIKLVEMFRTSCLR